VRTARRALMASRHPAGYDLISQYQGGATHEQHTVDSGFGWGSTEVANGRTYLAQVAPLQNQHIGGFGVLFLEWDNDLRVDQIGTYGFADINLDNRVDNAMSSASKKMITLALASPYLREGTPPVDDDAFVPTEWYTARIDDTMVDEFATQCAAVAARYTDVEYFQVWNELKNYYRNDLNRWDYEDYTTMYNAVYTAVKAARPDAKVGGPYNVMRFVGDGPGWSHPSSEVTGAYGVADQRDLDVVKYWLENKTGADFMCWDGGNVPADADYASDSWVATDFLADVNEWVRALNPATYPGCDTLPIIWSEMYIWPDGVHGKELPVDQTLSTWAWGMINLVRSGSASVIYWSPNAYETNTRSSSGNGSPQSWPLGLITDVRDTGGGQPTELHPIAKHFQDHFCAGRALYDVSTGNANIKALGSDSAGGRLLLVNKANSSQATSGMPGASVQTLTAYEVRLITWTPS
jgi:hypothetical protein